MLNWPNIGRMDTCMCSLISELKTWDTRGLQRKSSLFYILEGRLTCTFWCHLSCGPRPRLTGRRGLHGAAKTQPNKIHVIVGHHFVVVLHSGVRLQNVCMYTSLLIKKNIFTWPVAERCASMRVSLGCPAPPPILGTDIVTFFFLPRFEGVGMTTTWDVSSPSFLSNGISTTEGLETHNPN